MSRAGLTLMETLASLALLGLLAIASLGWITASQRTLAETSETVEWRRSAQAALALLDEDLSAGDAANWTDTPLAIEPAIDDSGADSIETIGLMTRVAGVGPAATGYRHDRETGVLTRSVGGDTRVLLGRVASFGIERPSLPGSEQQDPVGSITVTLTSTDGETVRQLIHLGAREVGG